MVYLSVKKELVLKKDLANQWDINLSLISVSRPAGVVPCRRQPVTDRRQPVPRGAALRATRREAALRATRRGAARRGSRLQRSQRRSCHLFVCFFFFFLNF